MSGFKLFFQPCKTAFYRLLAGHVSAGIATIMTAFECCLLINISTKRMIKICQSRLLAATGPSEGTSARKIRLASLTAAFAMYFVTAAIRLTAWAIL